MSKLIVVGIGPGDYENMTVRADRALQSCDVIIGYTVYVDLVKERYPDKEFLTTPMTRETQRCQMAIEELEKLEDFEPCFDYGASGRREEKLRNRQCDASTSCRRQHGCDCLECF